MSQETFRQIPLEERSTKERLYKRLSSRKALIALTIGPPIALYTLVLVFPILWAFAAGFHSINTLSPEWHWSGLENYVWMFQDDLFRYSLWLSLVFAAGSIAIQTTIGVLFALLLNQEFPFQKITSAVFFLPFLVPTAIVAYMILWMTNQSWGILNWMLVDIGLLTQPVAWFGRQDLAMASAVVTNSWKYIAFATIMVYARLQSIPDQLYEVGNVMGATTWQQFVHVTLPNIKGVIFIVTLINGIWMFFKFDILWILTQGGPGDATRISVIYAYQMAFEGNHLGRAAAMSVMLFLIVVAGAILYFKVFEPESEVRVE